VEKKVKFTPKKTVQKEVFIILLESTVFKIRGNHKSTPAKIPKTAPILKT
jgi:hypothetical protein